MRSLLTATLLCCVFLWSCNADSCPSCSGGACDCSWTNNKANCGTSDGSCCWNCCCASTSTIKTCPSCTCDCAWTNNKANCGSNDGSCCWGCCCAGSTPPPPPPPATPPPPPPPATPPPPPSPPPAGKIAFCPKAADLQVAYTNNAGQNPVIRDRGWTLSNGGGVATKAAFNLIGGYVEFDIDFRNCGAGVNANIYTISPNFAGSQFNRATDYCDGQGSGNSWCAEVDWIESNGNCGGASTLHTRSGTGSNGCTAWGCSASYSYNGQASFHMKVSYDSAGKWTTVAGSTTISPTTLSPAAQALDWSTLVSQYTTRGAVIYSSLWTGWVPTINGCSGSGGSLASSSFTISNLKIVGTVVRGPPPATC